MQEDLLISKCKNGDGEAFRHLMNIYKTRLYGYLFKFSNTKDFTEDLFQETLIKVWKGFKKYNHQQKFSSWLFTIAHNVAMDNLRSIKNNKTYTDLTIVEQKLSSENLESKIIINETLEIINKTVEQLSNKQKTVFLLRQHGEMTFKEIAEAINEPLNTVISHMHYAMKKIRKQIEIENEPRRTTAI
ncbi:MAG: RNA polymerase sigma factor [Ignavibacteriae bacterium]|nr:RNA polymerase sigma factor [Ignavibacteriota bacterium]MCB9208444.1 RNA polymerase sigma factor [Ignavibacteriales bacterium]MCB9258448.1 RNA polymerase sigma factor [Ignavibacteriales bacterium]